MKISEKYIQSYTHNGHIGVLVEFGLESSILARTEEFTSFTRSIAMHIAALNPENLDELLSQEYVKDTSISIDELVMKISESVSENICITRFIRWETWEKPDVSDDPPPKSPAVAMRVVK